MNELIDLLTKFQRSRAEPTEIQSAIEELGGEVLEMRHVARLIPCPFRTLRILPLLYEFRADHGGRRGYWYVRTSADGAEYDWAWCDLDGYETAPVPDICCRIANDTHAVGWLRDSLVVSSVIVGGILACIGIAWFLL